MTQHSVLVISLLLAAAGLAFGSDRQCMHEPDSGHRAANHQRTTRYYYSPLDKRCKPFTFYGSGGNGNNFESEEDCQYTCDATTNICVLPKVEGTGSGSFTRYFYNPRTGNCEAFNYKGFNGNANKFIRSFDCETRCQSIVRLACEEQGMMPGYCPHAIQRWYYDRNQKTCKPFVYSGCNGNENRFETKGECENTCVRA